MPRRVLLSACGSNEIEAPGKLTMVLPTVSEVVAPAPSVLARTKITSRRDRKRSATTAKENEVQQPAAMKKVKRGRATTAAVANKEKKGISATAAQKKVKKEFN